MAEKKKSYQELKSELEKILSQLESDAVDIDEAAALYEKGQKLAAEIEQYLLKVKAKIKIIKPRK